MPSVSKAQRIVMAIAEHHPSQLNPENRGLLRMSKGKLHEFAATPEKGLPQHVKKGSGGTLRALATSKKRK